MPTEKVSLTLDDEFLVEVRERVGARIAGLLAELEQEQGPIEPEVMERPPRLLAWPISAGFDKLLSNP
ncbi:MAG TPA: hypothetical protein VF756_24050 [Thermoanaerobaculia bacterium]